MYPPEGSNRKVPRVFPHSSEEYYISTVILTNKKQHNGNIHKGSYCDPRCHSQFSFFTHIVSKCCFQICYDMLLEFVLRFKKALLMSGSSLKLTNYIFKPVFLLRLLHLILPGRNVYQPLRGLFAFIYLETDNIAVLLIIMVFI